VVKINYFYAIYFIIISYNFLMHFLNKFSITLFGIITFNMCQAQSAFQLMPNINLPDTAATIISLSKYNKQLVLIDFWASWCRPCRRYNNPWIKEMHSKYAALGLQIISISLDDDIEKWKKAIAKDSLQGLLLIDSKAWNGNSAQAFNVKSIPAKFLYNNGQLIANNISMSETETLIKNLLHVK
jgi:thiol-disulfide isomerase/thioredoxin